MPRRFYLLVVLCLPIACHGQPSGQLQFPLTNNLLWDFSGTYARTNGGLRAENTLVHSPKGVITGSGSARYSDGLNSIEATEISHGRVFHRPASGINVTVTGRGQFTGIALGQPISGPFHGNSLLVLDPTTQTLSGEETATLCVNGRGCRTVATNASFRLPGNMDGAWTLTLNVATTNRVVRGTGTAQLSNGRTVLFNVRGTYAPGASSARLKLTGRGDALGTMLRVGIGAENQLSSLRGKLFGQRLVFP